MSTPPGERDRASRPAAEAPPPSIGFALAFEAGRALLRLVDRELAPGIVIRMADFEIPDVSFPLDVSGGADRFQNRRLRLHALHVSLDLKALAPVLASRLARSGVSLTRWRSEQGVLAIEGRVGDALTGGFVAHVGVGALQGLQLQVQVFDTVCLGAASVTPTLVAGALLSALPQGAEQVTATPGACALDLAEHLLQPLLINHGWKRAAFETVDIDFVRVDEDRMDVLARGEIEPSWYASQPRPEAGPALQRAARAMAHEDQLAPLRRLLSQGQVVEAMREARLLADQFTDDDAVIAAALEALSLDPGGVDEARELFDAARGRADLAVLAGAVRLCRNTDERLQVLAELALAAQRLRLTVLTRRAFDAQGWSALQVDRTLDALSAFERALSVGGDDDHVLRGAFESCRALGRLADAVRFGERAMRAANEIDRDLAVAVGELHQALGDGERARRSFRRALREGPRADALLGLARVAAVAQDPTRAVSLLGAAAAAASEAGDRKTFARALAERAHYQLESLDDAAGAFRSAQSALELGANDVDLILVAARAADHLDDALRARELFERALQQDASPLHRAFASYRLGILLLEAGDAEQAEHHLSSAMHMAEDLPAGEEDQLEPGIGAKASEALLRSRAARGDLVARADLYLLEAGRTQEADERAAALLGAARCFHELGSRGAAIERLLDAVEVSPAVAENTPEMQTLIDGADAESLRFMARRLEILVGRPSYALNALRVARALRGQGALEEAEIVLRRALEQGASTIELLTERADIARTRRDLDGLDETLQLLAARDSGQRGLQALVERAALLAGPRGIPSQAVESYEAALARGADPSLLLNLSEALQALGDHSGAIHALDRACASPDATLRVRAARLLSALYEAAGQHHLALAPARLAEAAGEAEDVQRLDDLLERTGQLEELIRRFVIRPEAQKIRRAVELATQERGDWETALEGLTRLSGVDPADAAAVANWLLERSRDASPSTHERVLSTVLELDALPMQQRALQLQRAALLDSELNQGEQAIGLYQEMYAQGVRDRPVLLALRDRWLQQGDEAHALEVAGEISDIDEASGSRDIELLADHRIAGGLALRLGHDALAIRYLERLVEAAQGKDVVVEPPLLPQILQLVDLYATQGQHEDQSRTLARAVIQCRDDASRIDLYKRIAELEEHSLARPELAAQALERVLRLDPGDEEAAGALSKLYEFLDEVSKLVALHRERAGLARVPAQRAALLITAGDAVAATDTRTAARFYHEALDVAPESRAALEHLAQLARREGDHGMAVRGYLHAARAQRDDVAARMLEEAGALLAGLLLRPRFAARVLQRSVALDPTALSSALALIEVARACPEPERAIQVLEWLHQHDDVVLAGRVEAALAQADMLSVAEGDDESAWALYRRVLELDPGNVRALDALLVRAASLGALDTYQQLLEQRLQQPDRHATALRVQAATELLQQDPLAARGYLQAALGDESLDGTELRYVASLARSLDAPELLARALDRQLRANGATSLQERVELLRELASVLDGPLGDPQGAVGALQALLQIAPQDIDGHGALGELLLRLGQSERASPHLDRVLEAASGEELGVHWAAVAALRVGIAEHEGDDALVVKLLLGLSEHHPDNRGLRIRLASALERRGEVAEAARWLERALDLVDERGDRAYLLMRLARMWERAEDPSRAARAYLVVGTLDGAVLDAWRGAHRCAEASGDAELRLQVDRAIEDAAAPVEGERDRRLRLLEAALQAEQGPEVLRWVDALVDDEGAQTWLRSKLPALASLGLGRGVEAVVEHWPDTPEEDAEARQHALGLRARARLASGDTPGALVDLEAVWEHGSGDPQILETICDLNLAAGNKVRARRVLEEGARRSSRPEQAIALLQRWYALAPSAAAEEDRETFELWHRLAPDSRDARIALCDLHHQAGRWVDLEHVAATIPISSLEHDAQARLAWQRAEAAWRLDQVAEAQGDLAQAWHLHPDPEGQDPALILLAIEAFTGSDFAPEDMGRVVAARRRALEIAPGRVDLQLALVQALRQTGDHVEAEELARTAACAQPGLEALELFRAWFEGLELAEDPRHAETLRIWLTLEPGALQPRWALVRILVEQQQLVEAVAELRWLAENTEDTTSQDQALHLLAEQAWAAGREDDARWALLQLVDRARDAGVPDRELELLQQVLRRAPSDSDEKIAHQHRLVTLAGQLQLPQIERDALQAIEDQGQASVVEQERLAELWMQAGERARAAAVLLAASQAVTDPERIAVLLERWASLGVPLAVDDELVVLGRWVEADPDSVDPVLRRAMLLSATNRWGDALRDLCTLEDREFDDEQREVVDPLLAEAAAQCGDLDTEWRARTRVAEYQPTAQALEALAQVQARRGMPAQASETLLQLAQLQDLHGGVLAEVLGRAASLREVADDLHGALELLLQAAAAATPPDAVLERAAEVTQRLDDEPAQLSLDRAAEDLAPGWGDAAARRTRLLKQALFERRVDEARHWTQALCELQVDTDTLVDLAHLAGESEASEVEEILLESIIGLPVADRQASVGAYRRRAELHEAQADIAAATEDLWQAVQQGDTDAGAQDHLVDLLQGAGRHADARGLLCELAERDASRERRAALYRRWWGLGGAEDGDRVQSTLEQWLDVAPDVDVPSWQLYRRYRDQGLLEAARARLAHLHSLSEDPQRREEVDLELAEVCWQLGDAEAFVEVASALATAGRSDDLMGERRIASLADLERFAEAAELLELRAASRDGDEQRREDLLRAAELWRDGTDHPERALKIFRVLYAERSQDRALMAATVELLEICGQHEEQATVLQGAATHATGLERRELLRRAAELRAVELQDPHAAADLLDVLVEENPQEVALRSWRLQLLELARDAPRLAQALARDLTAFVVADAQTSTARLIALALQGHIAGEEAVAALEACGGFAGTEIADLAGLSSLALGISRVDLVHQLILAALTKGDVALALDLELRSASVFRQRGDEDSALAAEQRVLEQEPSRVELLPAVLAWHQRHGRDDQITPLLQRSQPFLHDLQALQAQVHLTSLRARHGDRSGLVVALHELASAQQRPAQWRALVMAALAAGDQERAWTALSRWQPGQSSSRGEISAFVDAWRVLAVATARREGTLSTGRDPSLMTRLREAGVELEGLGTVESLARSVVDRSLDDETDEASARRAVAICMELLHDLDTAHALLDLGVERFTAASSQARWRLRRAEFFAARSPGAELRDDLVAAVRARPGDDAVFARARDLASASGDAELLVELLEERAGQMLQDGESWRLLLRAAQAALVGGHRERATGLARRLAPVPRGTGRDSLEQAYAFASLVEEPSLALGALHGLVECDPEDASVVLATAALEARHGSLERAGELARRVTRSDAGSARAAWHMLWHIAREQGDPEAALHAISELWLASPQSRSLESEWVHTVLQLAQRMGDEQHRPADAARALLNGLDLHPGCTVLREPAEHWARESQDASLLARALVWRAAGEDGDRRASTLVEASRSLTEDDPGHRSLLEAAVLADGRCSEAHRALARDSRLGPQARRAHALAAFHLQGQDQDLELAATLADLSTDAAALRDIGRALACRGVRVLDAPSPQRVLAEANRLEAEGRLAEAMQRRVQVVVLNPGRGAEQLQLLTDQGRLDERDRLLAAWAPRVLRRDQAVTWLWQARVAVERDADSDHAATLLARALEQDPALSIPESLQRVQRAAQGDLDEQVRLLEDRARRLDDPAALLLTLRRLQQIYDEQRPDPDASLRNLSRQLGLQPTDLHIADTLVQRLQAAKRPREAARAASSCIEHIRRLTPDTAPLVARLALASTADEDSPGQQQRSAILAFQLGTEQEVPLSRFSDQAILCAALAGAAQGGDSAAWLELRHRAEQREDTLAAVAAAELAYCAEPSSAIRDQLEGVYVASQAFERLAQAYEHEVQRLEDPAQRASLLFNLASIYLEQLHRPARARRHLRAATALSPEDSFILRSRVEVERQHGTQPALADALEDLAAISHASQAASLLVEAGLALVEADAERAVALLEQSVQTTPRQFEAQVALGHLYERAANLEAAVVCYEVAADLATETQHTQQLWLKISRLAEHGLDDSRLALRAYLAAADAGNLLALASAERLSRNLDDRAALEQVLGRRAVATQNSEVRRDLLLERASLLSAEDRVREARLILDGLVKERPDDARVLIQGGGLLESWRLRSPALALYQRALELPEGVLAVDERFDLEKRTMILLAVEGALPRAAILAQRVLQREPTSEPAQAVLEAAAREMGDAGLLLQVVEARLRQAEDPAQRVALRIDYAHALELNEQAEVAATVLQQARAEESEGMPASRALFELLSRHGDGTSLAEVATVLGERLPDDEQWPRWTWALVDQARQTDNRPQAMQLLQQLVRRCPEQIEVYDALWSLLQDSLERSMFVNIALQGRRRVQEPAARARLSWIEADLRIEADDDARALEAIRDGLEAQPDHLELLQALRGVAQRRGHHEWLVPALEAAIAAVDDDTQRRAWLSELAQLLDGTLADEGRATQVLRRLLEVAPEDMAARQRLGALRFRAHAYAEAWELLLDAPAPEDAGEAAEQGLMLAECARNLGDLAGYEQMLRRALEHVPEHREAAEALALHLSVTDRGDEGLALVRSARSQGVQLSRNADLHWRKAEAESLASTGQLEQAVEQLWSVHELEPHDADVLRSLARHLRILDRPTQVAEALRRLAPLEREPAVQVGRYCEAAQALTEFGDLVGATRVFAQAIDVDASAVRALSGLAECALRLHDGRRFKEWAGRLLDVDPAYQGSAAFHAAYAEALRASGATPAAILRQFDRALEQAPADRDVQLLALDVAEAAGDGRRQVELLETLLENADGAEEIHLRATTAGRVARDVLGDRRRAIGLLYRAHAARPAEQGVKRELAQLYLEEPSMQREARTALAQLIGDDATDVNLLRDLAGLDRARGESVIADMLDELAAFAEGAGRSSVEQPRSCVQQPVAQDQLMPRDWPRAEHQLMRTISSAAASLIEATGQVSAVTEPLRESDALAAMAHIDAVDRFLAGPSFTVSAHFGAGLEVRPGAREVALGSDILASGDLGMRAAIAEAAARLRWSTQLARASLNLSLEGLVGVVLDRLQIQHQLHVSDEVRGRLDGVEMQGLSAAAADAARRAAAGLSAPLDRRRLAVWRDVARQLTARVVLCATGSALPAMAMLAGLTITKLLEQDIEARRASLRRRETRLLAQFATSDAMVLLAKAEPSR
ncbi:MAG: tetratricopeptide repeat protein [Pseudomonadota bacterium]